MNRFVVLLGLLLGGALWSLHQAEAALLCRVSATGQILESQSHGTPGTCERNYPGQAVEEIIVEEAERVRLWQEWSVHPTNPSYQRRQAEQQARQAKQQVLRAKLNLTPQEFSDLLDALRHP